MATTKLDKAFIEELKSDWSRILEQANEVNSLDNAYDLLISLRKFMSPLIGEILFDKDLWVNTLTKGSEANAEMAKIRFELDSILVDAQNLLESLGKELSEESLKILPSSNLYDPSVVKEAEERGVEPDQYIWNREAPSFSQNLQNLSDFIKNKLIPYLESKLKTFSKFYGGGYEDELFVDDVSVTFVGENKCPEPIAKAYMVVLKKVSSFLKKKNLDYLWEGRVQIEYSDSDSRVSYTTDPMDLIKIEGYPNKFIIRAFLYALGKRIFHEKLSKEKKEEFSSTFFVKKITNTWYTETSKARADFGSVFASYVMEELPRKESLFFGEILKEDYLHKVLEEQSKELDNANKLASLYFTKKNHSVIRDSFLLK